MRKRIMENNHNHLKPQQVFYAFLFGLLIGFGMGIIGITALMGKR